MAVEKKRGCGYRQVGGTYLVTDPGPVMLCDRDIVKLEICPHCEEMGFTCGVRPSRGFTWVIPEKILGGDHWLEPGEKKRRFPVGPPITPKKIKFNLGAVLARFGAKELCPEGFCPICRPKSVMGEKAGLLWINPRHYSVAAFIVELKEMGLSRRVAGVPQKFKIGETWLLLAHRDVGGIFYAIRPKRIEKLVTEETPLDELKRLEARNITPVVVPANDLDHNPGVASTSDETEVATSS